MSLSAPPGGHHASHHADSQANSHHSGNHAGQTGPAGPFSAGVPSPDAIQRQKDEHMRSLEAQLKGTMEAFGAQHRLELDAVRNQAEQQIRGFQLSVEREVKRAELALSQQYNRKMMMAQQQAEAQRAEIERQASQYMLQFNQCKTQDAFLQQNQVIEMQHAQMQAKMSEDMQRLGKDVGCQMQAKMAAPRLFASVAVPPGSPAVAYAAPPGYMPPSLPGTPQTSFVPPLIPQMVVPQMALPPGCMPRAAATMPYVASISPGAGLALAMNKPQRVY